GHPTGAPHVEPTRQSSLRFRSRLRPAPCAQEARRRGHEAHDPARDRRRAALLLPRHNGREEPPQPHRLKKAIEILTGEPYTIPTLDENPYGKPPAMGPVTPE